MFTKRDIIIIDGSESRAALETIRDNAPLPQEKETKGFDAEARAMIQSLYSRSPKSVRLQLESVLEADAGNFMEKFYVNYGHKSIGDCGYITIFIEQVSMFVAKAIQDNRLYSGQEASTRYLDFSQQPINDPVGTKTSKEIIDGWMKFYTDSTEPLRTFLKEKYPIQDGENEGTYQRAINARSFDILRGFLPSGSTTLLAWTTNLRQAADKLEILLTHPMLEVRETAQDILAELRKRYDTSFSHKERPEKDAYLTSVGESYFYSPETHPQYEVTLHLRLNELTQHQALLESRPKYTELPWWFEEYGQVEVKYLLDFGSFRDVQRHRAGIIRMPLMETRWGFQQWYLDQLSPDIKKTAQDLIISQNKMIESLECSKYDKQYYIPMGYNVPVKMTFGLPGLVYFAELRSGKTVHASLRPFAHKIVNSLKESIPGMVMHADLDLDDWDVRRGNQTIMDDKGKAISD